MSSGKYIYGIVESMYIEILLSANVVEVATVETPVGM